MAYGEQQPARAAIDLNSREILFLLTCIEITDGVTSNLPESKALYHRRMQEYVGTVSDAMVQQKAN
jgi:hypothetical protein